MHVAASSGGRSQPTARAACSGGRSQLAAGGCSAGRSQACCEELLHASCCSGRSLLAELHASSTAEACTCRLLQTTAAVASWLAYIYIYIFIYFFFTFIFIYVLIFVSGFGFRDGPSRCPAGLAPTHLRRSQTAADAAVAGRHNVVFFSCFFGGPLRGSKSLKRYFGSNV